MFDDKAPMKHFPWFLTVAFGSDLSYLLGDVGPRLAFPRRTRTGSSASNHDSRHSSERLDSCVPVAVVDLFRCLVSTSGGHAYRCVCFRWHALSRGSSACMRSSHCVGDSIYSIARVRRVI